MKMQQIRTYAIAIISSLVLLLTGCATSQTPVSDPDYAPVRAISSKPLPVYTGSIYRTGYEVALFEDTKARHIGDILTVILQESTNASKKASTNTSKESDADLGGPTIFGKGVTKGSRNFLEFGLEASRSFAGEGDSSQSNSLNGKITVTVSEVLPNGNLMIRGEKLLTLNQGVEHIRLAGIIRADDITPDNTIHSSKIANAKIIYGGEGVIAETNTKGWLQRAFDSSWWPF